MWLFRGTETFYYTLEANENSPSVIQLARTRRMHLVALETGKAIGIHINYEHRRISIYHLLSCETE